MKSAELWCPQSGRILICTIEGECRDKKGSPVGELSRGLRECGVDGSAIPPQTPPPSVRTGHLPYEGRLGAEENESEV